MTGNACVPVRVSVGLPVRNGEAYLQQALDASLRQTYSDFEIIVSDNASTDRTEEIGRDYAASDPRVRYFRSETNRGAAINFNITFGLAQGQYFRWAAHDDLVEPTFLERCVDVLENDPSVVLAHTKVRIIDPQGNPVGNHVYGLSTASFEPRRRFYDLLFVRNQCYEVFGLIRSSTLRETGLQGAFPVGDRVLLAELALRGRFFEVPEYLFLSRDHGSRSVRKLKSQQERAPWFDTRVAGKLTFPEWRTFIEYWRAIDRSPLTGSDRLMCQLYMLKWVRHYRKRMRRDVWMALNQVARSPQLLFGPTVKT